VVTQFQSRFGLVADGVVGRQTMARLDDLIMSQSNLEEAESFTIAREEFSLRTAKPVS
jgi:murein L,D-transpeptidase YcbB/YkuD